MDILCCTCVIDGRESRGSCRPCCLLDLRAYDRRYDGSRRDLPACGKVVDGHDAASAWLRGEVVELGEAGSLGLKTDVLESGNAGLAGCWAANHHAETL